MTIEQAYIEYEEKGYITEIIYDYWNGLLPITHQYYEERGSLIHE